MRYVIRSWNCTRCLLPNKTVVELNGTVKCEHCADVTSVQSSEKRRRKDRQPSFPIDPTNVVSERRF
jgi:hypothetical protein